MAASWVAMWDNESVFWLVGLWVVAKVFLLVVGLVVGWVASMVVRSADWMVESSAVVWVFAMVGLWVGVMVALLAVSLVVGMVGMMVDKRVLLKAVV